MNKTIKALTPIVSILAIVGLTLYALNQGIDGLTLAGAMAIIGGIGGYEIRAISKP